MEIDSIVGAIAGALKQIDSSGVPFKDFQPGVGRYGEPQLVKLVAGYLNDLPHYAHSVKTMRTPDLLVRNQWALEIKIARPFGDNGNQPKTGQSIFCIPIVATRACLEIASSCDHCPARNRRV
jgi:hypothetical protein